MPELNHTIVRAGGPKGSASFPAGILCLKAGRLLYRFTPVMLPPRVSLDHAQTNVIAPHRYTFLVSEGESDAAFGPAQPVDLPSSHAGRLA